MAGVISKDTAALADPAFESATLVELLRRRAQAQGEQRAYTFLTDGEADAVHLTYGELDQQARVIGAKLQQLGATGERVLLLYPPGLQFIAAFFGCLYAGAVAVPVYPPRPNQSVLRLQSIVTDAQAGFALVAAAQTQKVSDLLNSFAAAKAISCLVADEFDPALAADWHAPDLNGERLAFLQYTSGSTTDAKGVMVSHRNILHNELLIKRACEHTAQSTFVGWLPFYHDMGLIGNVLQPLYLGAAAVLMSPAAFLQRPLRWLQAISDYKGHTSGGPNFSYELCVQKIAPAACAALDLSSWQVAFNGAEPIRPETLDRFTAAFAPYGFRREAFYPCYGLAEATLMVSGGQKRTLPRVALFDAKELQQDRVLPVTANDDDTRPLVGCGTCLGNQRIAIVNPHSLIRCAPGQVGEIWLAGPSVAQGYWGRPAETAHTFQASLADTGEGPFLRTGDLGFFAGEELFITGRLKDLIIVRGLNHYPQDIELTVERCHPALRPGCGAAFALEQAGEERVVVVQEVERQHKELDLQAIVDTICAAVSLEHELQLSAVVLISAGTIPKTSSGKIRRRACRAQFLANSLQVLHETRFDLPGMSLPEYVVSKDALAAVAPAARKEIVKAYLENLVCRLLSASPARLAGQQSLAQLGLDSLKAAELSAELARHLAVDIEPVDILRAASIDDLAGCILRTLFEHSDRRPPAAPVLKPGSRPDPLPVSFAQQRLWFLDQLVQGSAFYNVPVAIQLAGPLHLPALEQSLNEIVRRHDSLRTIFSTDGARPVQVIQPELQLTTPLIDLRAAVEDDAGALARLTSQEARRPFDLTVGPLIRTTLLRLGEQAHVLLVVMHHIISDGWSVNLFMRELATLYAAYAHGQPAPLPELALQYADYALWQREWLQGATLTRQLAFWQSYLAASPALLNLPTDYPPPRIPAFSGAREKFELAAPLVAQLKDLARQNEVTLYMTLLAAFQVLLYRYTGADDICVGTVTHNRTSPQTQELIGFFANTLVIRNQVAGEQSFRQLLTQVRQSTLDVYANSDAPFEQIVQTLQPGRDLNHNPLFQVMFILQNDLNAPSEQAEFAGLSLRRLYELEGTGTSKRDLTLYLIEKDGGLLGLFEYDSELFSPATIARLAGHLQTLLAAIVAAPDDRVATLSLLTQAEQRQLLSEWSETRSARAPDLLIHELFEQQAARTPGALAAICEQQQLTYAELNRRSNQLAHHLRTLGVGPDVPVGIYMRRSLDLLVGIVAILKAGGAYVPIDPQYPAARTKFMLANAGVALVLMTSDLGPNPLGAEVPTCFLDACRAELAQTSQLNLKSRVSPANLAYIIYTSGSTGETKGVMITHGNLTQYVQSISSAVGVQAHDRYLHTASFAFSSSVRQLMLPLTQGATVVVASPEQIADPLELFALIKECAVTIIDLVPSYWRNCNLVLSDLQPTARAQLLDNQLRLVLSASEPLTSNIPQTWTREFGHPAALINMFGQTETTGIATLHAITRHEEEQIKLVPIGRPLPGTRTYLLDPQLNPVPVGIRAELYIGGADLGRGYLKQPALTAERFVPDPFSGEPGARLYRTGDLARHTHTGELEYVGRADDQVKINGVRIEPGEIANVLAGHPAIRAAIVCVRARPDRSPALVAYLVPALKQPLNLQEVRNYLTQKLPRYMIPAAFATLPRLPLTANGKVDRRALPDLDLAAPGPAATYISPQTPVEEQLARIWGAVLGLPQISVRANFFELGGNSLLATQIMSRTRDTFKIQLPLRLLFDDPTIAGLAREVERVARQSADQDTKIRRVARGGKSLQHLLDELKQPAS